MLLIAWVYRHIFNCCRRVDNFLFSPEKKDESIVPITLLPWLWIGGVTNDGTTIDFTADVNEAVSYGVKITPEWLSDATGVKDVVWKYLNATTLEQSDFPSDGFVIDAPVESEPQDESNFSDAVEDDSE
jgi:hypothetical protein